MLKIDVYRAARMRKRQAILLLALAPLLPLPVCAQGTMEFGSVHAGAIGLGAGLAASRGHGKVVQRSYEAMLQAEQATIVQTKAIEQYMTLGCQLESQKRWSDAEKSFNYVLKVVAMRDGPGSVKSVPALQHLVSVSKQQGKLTEAINFQKTVLSFAQSARVPNNSTVLQSQIDLSNLFILKNDYTSAEPILRSAISTNSAYQVLPPEKRKKTLAMYRHVLRKLNRESEADALEVNGTLNDPSGSSGSGLSESTSASASISASTSPSPSTSPSISTATATATKMASPEAPPATTTRNAAVTVNPISTATASATVTANSTTPATPVMHAVHQPATEQK